MNILSVLKKAAPIAARFIPNGDRYVPLIVAGMEVAEESGKKGKDKKEIAKKVARTAAEVINLKFGQPVIDLDRLDKTAEENIDFIVDISNAMSGARELEAQAKTGIDGLFK